MTKEDLLLNNAISFKKSGERSLEERDINENQYEMLMIPAVVNLSFSAELFLKYILQKQNIKFGRIHNLKDLYEKLDENSKVLMTASMYLRFQKGVSNPKPFFNEKLDSHSDLFIKWRYIHENIDREENMECDYGFMHTFVSFLEELAIRFRDNNSPK